MRKILIAVTLAVACVESFGQITLDSVIQNVALFNSIPQEKIFLHLNKPYYVAGDTVWLKVYLVNAREHLMTDTALSTVIYVDVVKKGSGRVYHHLILKNSPEGASGAITLSDTIKAGAFEINAYSNWMKNFSDHSFQKEIFIYDPASRSKYNGVAEVSDLATVADLQFFPEGGDLVSRLFNRVAFKAVNKLGKGVDVNVSIVSEKGDTVATGLSQHLGRGKIAFVPQPGMAYHAILKNMKSSPKFYLPKVQDNGFVMLLDRLGDKDNIKIIVTNTFPGGEKPFVVVHQRGKIFYSAQSQSMSTVNKFSVPRKDIPYDGIVHITVFNGQGLPVCERLIYNRLHPPAQVRFKPDATNFGTRQKMEMEIEISDDAGNPLDGDFSLSVTDASQVVDPLYPETIETYLLLTSDVKSSVKTLNDELRGGIEQPGYYFTSPDPNRESNLDLLLVTQGWRRFTWNDVLKIESKMFAYEFETGLSIKGKGQLENRNRTLSQPLDIVMTIWKNRRNEFMTTKSDSSGSFQFSNLDFTDSVQVLVQGRRDKGKTDLTMKLMTDLNTVYEPVHFSMDPLISQWSNSYDKSLEEYWKGYNKSDKRKVVLLQSVEVKAKREEPDDRKRMYSGNYQALNVENENCGTTLANVLRSRVAGLMVSGYPPNEVFMIRNRPAEFVLDGNIMPMEFISTIQPCNLEEIDVFHTAPAGLGSGRLPVISMLSKRANPNYDWSKQKSPGVIVAKVMGYQKRMEFYSPVYDLVDQGGDHATDFRSALYWNPFVTTGKDGKATVAFWNSDSRGKFNVHLEGISSSGKAVAKTWSYSVE